jgi:hypothetical protein
MPWTGSEHQDGAVVLAREGAIDVGGIPVVGGDGVKVGGRAWELPLGVEGDEQRDRLPLGSIHDAVGGGEEDRGRDQGSHAAGLKSGVIGAEVADEHADEGVLGSVGLAVRLGPG